MSKIVICGSLKNINRIELLGQYLKQAIPTAEVIVPMKDLEMFQAQKEYIGHIFNADTVMIVPKSIKYDINIINSSGYFLHNDHGIISEYFHKPYFIVTDETFIGVVST